MSLNLSYRNTAYTVDLEYQKYQRALCKMFFFLPKSRLKKPDHNSKIMGKLSYKYYHID